MKYEHLLKRVALTTAMFLICAAVGLSLTATTKAAAADNVLIQSLTADKAMYAPGSTVKVTVKLQNETGSDIPYGYLQLVPFHLDQQAGAASQKGFTLAFGSSASYTFTWKVPKTDYQGYMLLLNVIGGNGKIMDSDTVGVDVSSSWVKYPRYGYVWDYSNSLNTNNVVEPLKDFHLNALQYYDWEYRHQQPVANNLTAWKNWSGESISGNTLRSYIKTAKSYNIVNMAYNMIYGVTGTFDAQKRAAWGMYYKEGDHMGLPMMFTMGKPATGDNVLYFMNPLNTQWQSYIFAQEKKVFSTFGFDGWHADSVGEYGLMTNKGGGALDGKSGYYVGDTYLPFLNAAKAAIGGKYLTFNPVSVQDDIKADKSKEDVIYTEMWPWDVDRHGQPVSTYNSMKQLIEDSRRDSGGKSLVVAAYINYNEKGNSLNTATALLADAAAYAAGGSRMELGNGQNMLSHEFFPNDEKICMTQDLINRETHLYDFIVSYENLLRDNETETSNPVDIFNYVSDPTGGGNAIWYFTKKTGQYEILHMINLLGTDNQWRDADNTKKTPTKATNVPVKYYTGSTVRSVLFASPDACDGVSVSLPFKKGKDAKGSYVSFTVPSLEYWDMIYFSPQAAPNNPYTSFLVSPILSSSPSAAAAASVFPTLASSSPAVSPLTANAASSAVSASPSAAASSAAAAAEAAQKPAKSFPLWPFIVFPALITGEAVAAAGIWYFKFSGVK